MTSDEGDLIWAVVIIYVGATGLGTTPRNTKQHPQRSHPINTPRQSTHQSTIQHQPLHHPIVTNHHHPHCYHRNGQRQPPSPPKHTKAVEEVLHDVLPVLHANPEYFDALDRMCEPERQISFRVPW